MPSEINPHLRRKTRSLPSAEECAQGVLSGDRVSLGRAITLIESTLPEHRALADAVLRLCLPHAGRSVRIGITGVPGAGKSTFIETLGKHILQNPAQSVAVLAVDPSSRLSHGSILGDKTRMEELSRHERAFIRPSPTSGSLGGVARMTRETILLCESAGFDTIIVETVGVGQSEMAVYDMTDFFLLMLAAGAGDELQGIKRGIVEMADLILITKADGDNADRAFISKREYQNALHLFPLKENGWSPKVLTCSALTGAGVPEAWELVGQFLDFCKQNQSFERRREEQALMGFRNALHGQLLDWFYGQAAVKDLLPQLEKAVGEGKLSPFQAAEELLNKSRG